ncbi:ClpP-like prohead protease/major capsid protein fusion protein [Pseudomonas sp. MF6747]|uniref:ClpP-like prohead protease/major capsid protein fusion protein n=1 Tax=Pseudomonas sp. MF6747 TaxID=2797527 RepID=UPI00190DB325|nr:ClpP-like prohead protease/major capsid protein fusion protein [Pseudomonas sp. MF6747]MBK3511430.1 Clp protease ClpP [Pseudomonas sp. MF6747]MBK3511435.1 Clp protease ClpP [Pseudomonas sp. MF6747]
MMTKNNGPLMRPRASISPTNKPEESWYSIRAASRGVAEVMLYDDIGAWGISARQFARELAALGDVSQINLRIHSGGGDVMDGTAMYNILRGHSARVEVYIDGMAASMASVVAMAGDVIYMPANSMMMIHKPWGGQVGDADDMREYADLLDKVEGTLIQAYARKSGKSVDEIAALLKVTTWMDGNEAVAAGFADQVLEPIKAAAQLNSKRLEEYTSMPPHMKTLMNPRNSVTTPPAVPVVEPAPPVANASLNTDQLLAQGIAVEASRRNAISAAFASFAGHETLRDTCLGDTACTVEVANAKLLAAIGEKTSPTASQRHPGHVSNGNIVGDGVRASLYGRLGMEENEADNAYNHMTLRELARASLSDRGIGVASLRPMDMVGLAFTHDSSDFGNILLDASHRSLLQGWEQAEETYQLWTKKGRLSDFKVANRVGLGSFSTLREVRPGAEYKYITLGDSGETIRLATYGEIFSINRQAIINDDLDALSAIPRLMGEAARATIGDLVYDTLTNNGKMKDGKPLFDASRKNLFTGNASALSIEAMSTAKTAMALQKTKAAKDGDKTRTLNIRPAFLLCPVALEDKANQLIRSASVPNAQVNAGVVNPMKDFAQVISDPRLDDASSSAWYLAGKQNSDTIEVAYLDGVDVPYIDQMEGFTSDGIATKVRIDAGVSALDARGLNKSVGA